MSALVGCRHGGDPTNPQPCPSMCPVQGWPRYMFRMAWRGRTWVPRRKYRCDVQRMADECERQFAEIASGTPRERRGRGTT